MAAKFILQINKMVGATERSQADLAQHLNYLDKVISLIFWESDKLAVFFYFLSNLLKPMSSHSGFEQLSLEYFNYNLILPSYFLFCNDLPHISRMSIVLLLKNK